LGSRVHDCLRFAWLDVLHFGDTGVKSRLGQFYLGIVEFTSLGVAKELGLTRLVVLETKAWNARHIGHAIRSLINDFEPAVIEGVDVVFVLAGDFGHKISRGLDVDQTRLKDFSKVSFDSKTGTVLVPHHMMSFTFENGVISSVNTLPILNVQFIDTW